MTKKRLAFEHTACWHWSTRILHCVAAFLRGVWNRKRFAKKISFFPVLSHRVGDLRLTVSCATMPKRSRESDDVSCSESPQQKKKRAAKPSIAFSATLASRPKAPKAAYQLRLVSGDSERVVVVSGAYPLWKVRKIETT
jgi:hypothetical protein